MPPVVGAFHDTDAEVVPAATALTLETAPGAGVGWNITSTQ